MRDAALSAGRCFVEAYARSCMPLLLPAVERGLSGDNWRIRQSSLELCGDVLFKVGGWVGGGVCGGVWEGEGGAQTHAICVALQCLSQGACWHCVSRLAACSA